MTTPGASVLVVEDNLTNRKLVTFVLSKGGFDVRSAVDAEDALRILETFHPRLILLDLQLPGMDGLTLVRRLRATPATRDIVVIALTAYAMKGDDEKAFAAGCDGYITKPIDTRALVPRVAELLAVSTRSRRWAGA